MWRVFCVLWELMHHISARDGPPTSLWERRLIRAARRYAQVHRIDRDRYSFEMLLGIRRDLQERLVTSGERVTVYVPYGEAWYPYLMRRLAERPANLLFFLRAALL